MESESLKLEEAVKLKSDKSRIELLMLFAQPEQQLLKALSLEEVLPYFMLQLL